MFRKFNQKDFLQMRQESISLPLAHSGWRKFGQTMTEDIECSCLPSSYDQQKPSFKVQICSLQTSHRVIFHSEVISLHNSLFVLPQCPSSLSTFMKAMLSFLFPQLDALEFLHESEHIHGNMTTERIFVNPQDLTPVRASSCPLCPVYILSC